ncbi:MAG: bifunctional ornithine acetyltransferase/N-acetylglutamate synthase [Gammaproteobacteria bacterium]|nr:bifunctional ornithine acetyltransferase/N-acetylglutamate synthase [Gammaproteobacteria bacterium]|tara:strand:+ start:1848 stop:3044 length:1197 start_codon:yes stop_codon:yes gene_type:complete
MSKIKHIDGVELSSASSNTRYKNRDDVVVIKLKKGSKISAKFTNNSFLGAPVVVAKKHLKKKKNNETILLINAGNANAGNGKSGEKASILCCKEISEIAGINTEDVLPFSTGVIGEKLESKKLLIAFKKAHQSLDSSSWAKSSKAILTTDTRPKLVSKEINIGKELINITAFAKGSGMLRPNFATLLSFVFTDVQINKNLLDKLHREVLSESLERITIDGDTSPNDASLLVTTCKSKKQILVNSKEEKIFKKALSEIYAHLAELIIEDAEGATKKIKIRVIKAKSEALAKSIAFTVAHSPLVKTAFYGNDANWGRILAAIGRTEGVNDISKISISLNKTPLVKLGARDLKHKEHLATKAVKAKNLLIEISLNQGIYSSSVLTSDLSKKYVEINSDYRS